MDVLRVLLTVVEALCCVLLITVILIQRGKGAGAGVAFGGATAESLFGAQVGNVITKTTVILAVVFLVNTAALAILGSYRKSSSVTDRLPAGAPPPVTLPTGDAGFPTSLPE